LAGLTALDGAGYEQYEISNVARSGRQSRHNLKYWSDGEWLGFGCGAHSTCNGVRWKNVSVTADYVARVSAGETVAVERRELTAGERLEEALFTGLRLTNGLDLEVVGERYGTDVWRRYGADLQPFVDQGLVRHEGSKLSLSRQGMLVANEVMQVFV
jgi:oxygen-independent coproporphyrinogen-3 oxidase